MSTRTHRLTAALAAVLLLAAGCGGGDDTEATGTPPDLPTAPPELWNPCDGLDDTAVSTAFGTTFTVRRGSDSEPTCTFSPTTEGGPAIDVNYQLYAGTLEDLLKSFGVLADGADTRVSSPTVAGADDARVVSDVDADDTLAVTGFVRNGRLVQVVNALDPAPADRAAVEAAVTTMLEGLAAHAAESGISDEAPGSSPTDAPTE
ncbi:hypothetical protein ABFT23_11280 [Nocardioides sp. C4-1]|uniref:hypothetical protein n=1 Tax=Nocardioides sp. C4-1 TaxID=3151851 RepID=UPI00326752E9